jgi:DNA-binding NarL/FixJ family response regulator
VAAALYLSDSTVKVYVRNILGKLNAHTRAEAVARYAEMTAANSSGTPESPPSPP